jgi:YjbE family integral membrane protein
MLHFDWGSIFQFNLNFAFFLAMLNIFFINLILSGDNAVLIAMAVRNLPKNQRGKGMLLGTGAAVVLRVILTFFVALLLKISFLKLIGGLLIFWIAIKLFTDADEDEGVKQPTSLIKAIQIILIADLTMSLDNVLAVAGAAGDHFVLLVFGLLLSIPMVVFTAQLLSTLMDRYPIIIVIGAAILGRVAAEMILTDPALEGWFHPSVIIEYFIKGLFMLGVVLVGKYLSRQRAAKKKLKLQTDVPKLGVVSTRE